MAGYRVGGLDFEGRGALLRFVLALLPLLSRAQGGVDARGGGLLELRPFGQRALPRPVARMGQRILPRIPIGIELRRGGVAIGFRAVAAIGALRRCKMLCHISLTRGVWQIGGASRVMAVDQVRQHFVKPPGQFENFGRGLRGAGIEPGEMCKQEARVKAAALPHRLTAEPDGFLRAVNGPHGQNLLRRFTRDDKRGIPPTGKGRIAAAADIGRLRRNPRRQRGGPHIAIPAERFEKGGDARRGEDNATRKRN
jgi:hypothetical protein